MNERPERDRAMDEWVDWAFFEIAVMNVELDVEIERKILPLYDWEQEEGR